MLEDHVVVNSDIARSLICDMDVMTLRDKADERSSHRNHIVVRMGREDKDSLGKRRGAHRPEAVVGPGLAPGPPCNGMLKVV